MNPPTDTRHQRIGAENNTAAGAAFEQLAEAHFTGLGLPVRREFSVDLGFGLHKKPHRFDLGCEAPATLIECKSHTWTTSGNIPSAKITTWREAMLYFSLCPPEFRKILFVLKHARRSDGETLGAYFFRRNHNLIPPGTEIIEFDERQRVASVIQSAI